jgi:hypothetical protein
MAKTKAKKFDDKLTPAQFKSKIVSAIRQASRWWGPKQECIWRARVGRGKYKCELCKTVGPLTLPPKPWLKRKRKNIQADHIEPAVPLSWWESYDSFIERLFVPASELQALCWECHSKKTKEEGVERRALKKANN